MRYFNTSGPCYPDKHYMVMREALIAKGRQMVERGRYFTIFAPRQAGKTTYFQLLLRKLKTEGEYTPIWISFESLKTLTRTEFYEALTHKLCQELSLYDGQEKPVITNPFHLVQFFENLRAQIGKLVLVIDEFEGILDVALSEIMHAFRELYHRKEHHCLHSLMLVGVSTLAELVVSSASPFNVAEELRIPYFTFEEVQQLIRQYEEESGQSFEPQVIRTIYDNTQGQPGLVCGLCLYLIEQAATDRTQPVSMSAMYATLKHFLTERFDKNILNIVQKAREKREFMLKLLFGDASIPFTVNDPDIAYLYAHGVVSNINSYVQIPVPLYSKVLITAFRPLINGEPQFYISTHDTFDRYITPDGLNMHAILEKYREYIRRRGFRAFDAEHLKEGAWHYSLDGFMNFFLEVLGGETFVEVPSGRGRTDILVLYKQSKYIIETKIFTNAAYFQRGKRQLAEYLTSEGLKEGYYVVFSNIHTKEDELFSEEIIQEKSICTYIICTQFEQASRLSQWYK